MAARFLVSFFLLTSAIAETPSQHIDALLDTALRKAGLQRNSPASDEVFLRRVYLDAIGRAPTLPEARAFLSSDEPHKRSQLIDALLANDTAYMQGWYNFWADILRLKPYPTQRLYWNIYVHIIRDALQRNRPYDEWVRDLVSARGHIYDNPNVAYQYRDLGMPLDNLAMTMRVFLGTRIECAQCHDHPFDKWKQMDFYRLAATPYRLHDIPRTVMPPAARFKEHVAANHTPQRSAMTACLNDIVNTLQHTHVEWGAEPLKLPHDYQYQDAKPHDTVQPAVLFGTQPTFTGSEKDADAFAAWLTSPENPRFATVIANRLWRKLFGVGLIEPHDEITDSTVPSHRELMTYLAQHMCDVKFDLRAFLRTVLNTQAYQAEARTEEHALGDTSPFTGPQMRRLTAEQFWDSMVAVVSPTPELIDLSSEAVYQARVSHAWATLHQLEKADADHLYDYLLQGAEAFQRLRDQGKELQAKALALREAGDEAGAKALAREIEAIGQQRPAQNLRAYIASRAAEDRKRDPGKPDPILDLPFNPNNGIETTNYIQAHFFGPKAKIPPAWQTAFDAEMQSFAIPEAQRATYRERRLKRLRSTLRAAEYPESNAAQLLRDLGQSDREVIENGNTDASIPQALNLMNNELLLGAMTTDTSALQLHLKALPTDEEKISTLFLALLTRRPTEADLSTWKAAAAKEHLKLPDLIHALLNTRQVMFVK